MQERSKFRLLLHNDLIRDAIFDALLPSDIGALLCAEPTVPIAQIPRRYFDPIRQMGQYEQWIRRKIQEGCRVLLVGKDVKEFKDMLTNPAERWETGGNTKLVMWLAITPRRPTLEEVKSKTTLPLMDRHEEVTMVCGDDLALYGPDCIYKSPFYLPADVADELRVSDKHWTERLLTASGAVKIKINFCSVFNCQVPGMRVWLDSETSRALAIQSRRCCTSSDFFRMIRRSRAVPSLVDTRFRTRYIGLNTNGDMTRFAHEIDRPRYSGEDEDFILLLLRSPWMRRRVHTIGLPLLPL